MPTPEFARDLVLEADAWVEEGLISRDQFTRLRDRYRDLLSLPAPYTPARPAGARATSGALTEFLYGLAGVLVGAAALVVLFVGLDVDEPAPFALTGLLLVAAGAGLRVAGARPRVADALLAAGLVPLTTASFPDDDALWSTLALAVALALVFWRREATFVPSLAVAAFTVAAGATFFEIFDDLQSGAWMLVQAVLLVSVVASDRVLRGADSNLAAALAVLAAVVPFVIFLGEETQLQSEGVELALGAVMLAVGAAGVALRHKGVALGAAIVVGVDAIVFAFDVGGAVAGTLILLGLAGLLVWQAELLRRWLRGT